MWRVTARSHSLQLLLRPPTSCVMPSAKLAYSGVQVAAPCMRRRSFSSLGQGRCSPLGASLVAMAKPWRPDMNDVDRLSRGDGARKRGTGNFNIPHRLNQDERPVYEAAKKKAFLSVKGTGYRKQRKGHPLPNIYRQWCDAHGQATVVIEQDASGDCVVVDLATLRLLDTSKVTQSIREAAQELGLRELLVDERPADAVPFDIIPYKIPDQGPAASAAPPSTAGGHRPAAMAAASPEDIAAAQAAIDEQGALIRELKAQGENNQSPAVQKEVQELLARKAHLEQLAQSQQHKQTGAAHVAADTAYSAVSSNADASASTSSNDSSSNDSSHAAQSTLSQYQEQIAGKGTSAQDGASDGSNGKQRQGPLADDHPLATLAIWQIPAQPLFFTASRPVAKQLAKHVAAMKQ